MILYNILNTHLRCYYHWFSITGLVRLKFANGPITFERGNTESDHWEGLISGHLLNNLLQMYRPSCTPGFSRYEMIACPHCIHILNYSPQFKLKKKNDSKCAEVLL